MQILSKDLIDNSGLDVMSATEFQEAADKVQDCFSIKKIDYIILKKRVVIKSLLFFMNS